MTGYEVHVQAENAERECEGSALLQPRAFANAAPGFTVAPHAFTSSESAARERNGRRRNGTGIPMQFPFGNTGDADATQALDVASGVGGPRPLAFPPDKTGTAPREGGETAFGAAARMPVARSATQWMDGRPTRAGGTAGSRFRETGGA